MALPVFLINLDRSPDRLARCAPPLDALGLPWERVSAVDGARLEPDDLRRLNPQPPPHGEWFRPLTAGEIGCFLSHLRCWQLIAERDLACGLILEDDFERLEGCTRETLQALAATASRWDVLKLSHPLRRTRLVQAVAGIRLERGGRGRVDCNAYLLSRRGAAKLIPQRERIWRPVDFEFKHHWERGLAVLTTRPALFHQLSHEQAASIIGERTEYRAYPALRKARVYLRKHRYHARFWLADRLGVGRQNLLNPQNGSGR
jgi:glycosyl transferase family 25